MTMITARLHCGHTVTRELPEFEDRKDATFFGPDDVPSMCPECEREREEKEAAAAVLATAQALRNADMENTELRKRIKLHKARALSQAESNVRVDRLIGLIETLVMASAR
jgi:hypothetical protein